MPDPEALKPVREALEMVRERIDYTIRRLQELEEFRCMRWRCVDCSYLKHFTRPMPAAVAPPCPKCGGKKFVAMA
jgi:hypothetical protein